MRSNRVSTACLLLCFAGLSGSTACSDDAPPSAAETGESTQGDGDGDGDATGDGDGDGTGDGDGDGDPTGDGDGDPTGDGDGDGDATGDGDGDEPTCGDGQVDEGEACDDGNNLDNDGCDADCTPSIGAMKVTTGYEFTCVLTWEGQVRCWGDNGYGQLGLGLGNTNSVGDDELPSSSEDVDIGGVAVDIAAGHNHVCALLEGGDVVCWGRGDFGQLGYGNTDWIGDDEAPADAGVVSVGGSVTELHAGMDHTCVLTEEQDVRCWGIASSGQLGQGNTTQIGDNELPSTIPSLSLGGPVEQLATGANHACALLVGGEVRCWGNNAVGTLGQGNTTTIGDTQPPSAYPVVSLGDLPIVELAAGFSHTCARFDDGSIRCWGDGGEGRLGYASTANIGDDELPSTMPTVDVGGPVDELYLNFYNTCARIGTELKCWGWGQDGANGYGNVETLGDDEVPASSGFVDVGIPVAGISRAGLGFHACAFAGESVRCWGQNVSGQLGYGNSDIVGDSETPSEVGDVPWN